MNGITMTLESEKVSDPTDLTFLISQLRALPSDARKYLTWAGFFGERYVICQSPLLLINAKSASRSLRWLS